MKFILFVLTLLFTLCLTAFAQEAGGSGSQLLDQALLLLGPVLEGMAGKYGLLAQVLLIVGGLRLLFKPLVSLAQGYVNFTPNPKDNEILAKIMDHWAYKAFAYFLDWSASLKLPKLPS